MQVLEVQEGSPSVETSAGCSVGRSVHQQVVPGASGESAKGKEKGHSVTKAQTQGHPCTKDHHNHSQAEQPNSPRNQYTEKSNKAKLVLWVLVLVCVCCVGESELEKSEDNPKSQSSPSPTKTWVLLFPTALGMLAALPSSRVSVKSQPPQPFTPYFAPLYV